MAAASPRCRLTWPTSFGTQFVGAIHGRLLTAWSTAGIIGPVLVSYMREAAIGAGVPRSSVYDVTLYLLAGLLVIGLIANLLVRPVPPKWLMSDADVTEAQGASGSQEVVSPSRTSAVNPLSLAVWVVVGLPILWGVWITVEKVAALFN